MGERQKRSISNTPKKRDETEQRVTDQDETLFERFKEEETVDPMPTEDIRLEQKEEKNKTKTKDESGSEKIHHRK
ncbi:hypothetical protein [Priestia megaterium]|jgi:hypothetical protein|uniref:Uncharacterized protein n=1 Tax=Priestia megaterium TaxID=1404 RepID=A0A6M6DPT1_PRIMG|nr:hypothetical protein [Priestia megaterium]KLV32435.1 hypothetical protein ABW04_08975 [Priestia megaterium]MCE4088308.1 hypothetical protein [Priestia megaterium]MED4112577.1 hypothetical protein [Priestia megaterium]QJX76422.1 hypothetical protein FDZ14_09555 [Priestia megaterium]UKJ79206.1 hypothetical protein H1W83_18630 [Priestia megaterium]